jgi:hypothetical protein
MELNSESVEVANVQWAKVCVESIIEESVIYSEVDRS